MGNYLDILVYDISSCTFRDLYPDNLDDDIECGLVLFDREILDILKDYYYICGYVLIDKKHHTLIPVDIQKDKVAIFEGSYNCMNASLKNVLVEYNIKSYTGRIISTFFIDWQFKLDWEVFNKHGAFIELCSNILGSEDRFVTLVDKRINLYEPTTYEELCYFTQNIFTLTDIDVNSLDYTKSFKYLIDSLERGYHINFSDLEIQNHYIQISKLVDERWEL